MSKLALRWGHSTASEPLLCPPVPPAPTAVLRTQFAPYVKVHDNYVSSIVQAENELLAPLAPFGRKLSQVSKAVLLDHGLRVINTQHQEQCSMLITKKRHAPADLVHGCLAGPAPGLCREGGAVPSPSLLVLAWCCRARCFPGLVLLVSCHSACRGSQPVIPASNLSRGIVRAPEHAARHTQGNAEGSIFYAPGNIFSSVPVFNPTVLAQAIFGGPVSLPHFGRKLSQAGIPDPYNFIPKARPSCAPRPLRQLGLSCCCMPVHCVMPSAVTPGQARSSVSRQRELTSGGRAGF